jgi:hypothetical protein
VSERVSVGVQKNEMGKSHPVQGVGAGLLTALLLLYFLMIAIVLDWDSDQPAWPWGVLSMAAIMSFFSFLLFVPGVLLGGIAWILSRRIGWHDRIAAIFIGFMSAALCWIVFAFVQSTYLDTHASIASIAIDGFPGGALFGTIGALAGLVAWHVAYRKQ